MHTSTTLNYTEQISTSHGILLASKALAFWHISVMPRRAAVYLKITLQARKRFDWVASFSATLEKVDVESFNRKCIG